MTSATTPKRRHGTLYLVRHGQTALNAAGVLRGRLDPSLDNVGEQQAQALGILFETVQVEAVVTSPLQRAVQTAVPIAVATGAPLVCDDAFLDRDYGPWAGKTREEVEHRYGALDRAPDVEPYGSLTSRAVFTARKLTARFDSLVVVAHDVVNRALLARLAANTADEPDEIPQRTGCWNRLERREADWIATVTDACPGDGILP